MPDKSRQKLHRAKMLYKIEQRKQSSNRIARAGRAYDKVLKND